MEKNIKYIEELKRDNRGGYRVPDGYFDELNHKIAARVAAPAQGGTWATLRSLVSFAAGFAVLVTLAITGYYFTGHQAQQQEVEYDNYFIMSLYDISTEDIIEYETEVAMTNSIQFADVAIEHLDIYGYDLVEITEE